MFTIDTIKDDSQAICFCRDFRNASPVIRGVFGRNEYANSIADKIEISFFIDDFTDEVEHLGKPVIKTQNIPTTALVVIAVTLGRPVTADKILSAANIRHLSYFSFYKYSGLSILPVTFWSSFEADFRVNIDKYQWVYSLLEDDVSKSIFEKLLNFRLSCDISYMFGFSDRQRDQYFEDFLQLKNDNEVFVDVGGFDGFTSLEFIRRCPGYKQIYFFEPEKENMKLAKSRLKDYKNITYISRGLSDRNQVVKFSIGGSASGIDADGDVEIVVDALDNLIDAEVSFIKMDIEGAETEAILGARKSILASHPILAICVYHKADDLWKIPELVLSIRNDYHVYLRHYTEGVTESVMFFVPKQRKPGFE